MAQCTPVTLASPSPVSMAHFGNLVAVDFNGDGRLDLASTTQIGSNVSVISVVLANAAPAGTFDLPRYYPMAEPTSSSRALAAGDFNGDGRPDLVSTNDSGGAGNISVSLNSGNGTFAPAVLYSVGPITSSVDVGDVNGDGLLDIVVSAGTASQFSALYGRPSPNRGSFQAPVTYTAIANTRHIRVVDVNADGRLDIVTVGSGYNGLAIFAQTAAGDFASPLLFPVPIGSGRLDMVVPGDFNADGRVDFAVLNGLADQVHVLMGSATGVLAPAVTYQINTAGLCGPSSFVLADMNADDVGDLVIGCDTGGFIGIMVGNANGTFAPIVNAGAMLQGPLYVATGDFNADGRVDVAATNAVTRADVQIELNTTPGVRAYVNRAATGAGTGHNWANAFTELRDALAYVAAHPCVNEVWVAAGTYTPTTYTGPASRAVSFQLQNNLAIYGGFAGTETSLTQRTAATIAAHPTILSGDLNGDDTPGLNRNDNSYHVVQAIGVGSSAILDGVRITSGEANGTNANNTHIAGGARIVDASPSFVNCEFRDNRALGSVVLGDAAGGAVYTQGTASCTFRDCRFVGNAADQGGAMGLFGGPFVLVGCVFQENTAGGAGAALAIEAGVTVALVRTDFIRNSGPNAALYALGNNPVDIINCRFLGNIGTVSAGAVQLAQSTATIANSLFVGNRVDGGPGTVGALGAGGGQIVITNSTFVANNAGAGLGALHQNTNSGGSTAIRNSILVGNTNSSGDLQGAQLNSTGTPNFAISQSTIEGWTGSLGGAGNNGGLPADDPRFIRLPSPGPDGVWGTVLPNGTTDDDYGDLRLASGSPAIDSADSCITNGSVCTFPADSYDINANGNTTEALPIDLSGFPRFAGPSAISKPVDRGCYEFQFNCPTCPGPRTWESAVGGDFTYPGNWSPSVPSTNHDAVFDLPAAYAVTFPSSQSFGTAAVRQGDVTFGLTNPPAGFTATLSATQATPTSLRVGTDSPVAATLRIAGGTVRGYDAIIGESAGSDGRLVLAGAPAQLDLSTPGAVGNLAVGGSGSGLLDVSGGAVVKSISGTVGQGPGSFGSVVLSGTNSKWAMNGGLSVFRGNFRVLSGATLRAGPTNTLGTFAQLYADATLEGTGVVQGGVFNLGTVQPGVTNGATHTPGTLTVQRTYEQVQEDPKFGFTSGQLRIHVDGPAAGQFDQLAITSAALLGGSLVVDAAPAAAALADGVAFLTSPTFPDLASGRPSVFDVAYLPRVPDGPGGPRFMSVEYQATRAVLRVRDLAGGEEFGSPGFVNAPLSPTSTTLGDVNGDGYPDLILTLDGTTPTDPGSVVILLNQGTTGVSWNNFCPNSPGCTVQIPVGRQPRGVVVADLDGDGLANDIATADFGSNQVTLIKNTGGLTFQSSTTNDAGRMNQPRAITAGNFARHNRVAGDTRADVAVCNYGSDTLSVMPNVTTTGAIVFIPGVFPPPATKPHPRAVSPWDEDNPKHGTGLLITGETNEVTVHANAGAAAGTAQFAPPLTFQVGEGALRAVAGNLGPAGANARQQDVVCVNRADGSVTIIRCDGETSPNVYSFRPPVTIPVGADATSAVLVNVDPDADNDVDVVVAAISDTAGERRVRVLRNDTGLDGNVVLSAPRDLPADGTQPFVLLRGDVDKLVSVGGHFKDDIVAVNAPGAARGPTPPLVSTRQSIAGGQIAKCPCPADFDGSGGTPDAGDIDVFFSSWLAGDAAADADCSGGTPDASDIDVFFQAWLAGGC